MSSKVSGPKHLTGTKPGKEILPTLAVLIKSRARPIPPYRVANSLPTIFA